MKFGSIHFPGESRVTPLNSLEEQQKMTITQSFPLTTAAALNAPQYSVGPKHSDCTIILTKTFEHASGPATITITCYSDTARANTDTEIMKAVFHALTASPDEV